MLHAVVAAVGLARDQRGFGKKPLSVNSTHMHMHTIVCCVCCIAYTGILSVLRRPVPTPNWRAPRPLTPPPTPVQQGHPLSAPPAQGAYSQTAPRQQGAFPADSAGPSQDSAATSAASVGVLSSREDSSASDGKEAVKGSAVG